MINIRTNQIKSKKRQQSVGDSWGQKFATVLKLIFLAVLILIFINSYISFDGKIQKVNKQISDVKRSSDELDKEIKALQNRSESLKGAVNIKYQIARFNLKLHLPQPHQIQQMSTALAGSRTNPVKLGMK